MKKVYILSFVALALCVASCEKEHEFDDVSQSLVTTSFGGQDNIIQVNDYMSFIDYSRGVKSLEWTFPEGVAFDEDLNEVVKSSEKVVKVTFPTPGTYYVKVKQEFFDEYYTGSSFVESTSYEENIEVQVRDSVRASYTAINATSGEAITISDDAMNQVEAGHVVEFTSTATGQPTTIKWSITRDDGFSADVTGDVETGKGSYKFSVPGVYNISMQASSELGNSSISNRRIVEIIASDDPVTLDGVERYSANEIGMIFSRAMKDAVTCDLSAFTVNIVNNGADVPCSVTGIASADNMVRVMLDTDIFSSDVITIGYDSTVGNLGTLDGVAVESFEDVQLTDFKVIDLLGEAGFDTSFETCAASDWVYLWWGAPWDKYTIEISTAQAYSGAQSTHLNMEAMGGAIFEFRPGGTELFFDAEVGKKYAVGFWSYVTARTLSENYPKDAFTADIRANLSTDNSWGYAAEFGDDTPLNEWVYRTIIVSTTTAGATKLQFRGANNTLPEEFDIYIDDMTVTEYEAR